MTCTYDHRLAATATDFQALLTLARSEAVKRSVSVVACPSSDGSRCNDSTGWSTGGIVFVDRNGNGARDGADEEVLKVFETNARHALMIQGHPNDISRVTFGPLGDVRDANRIPISLDWVVCDQRGISPKTPLIRLDGMGMALTDYAQRNGVNQCGAHAG